MTRTSCSDFDGTVTTINAGGSTAPGTLQSVLRRASPALTSIVIHATAGVTITGGAGFIVANMNNGSTVASVDTFTTGAGGGLVVLGKVAAPARWWRASSSASAHPAGCATGSTRRPLGAVGERAVVTGFQMMGNGGLVALTATFLQFAVTPVIAANNSAVVEGPNTYKLSNGVFTLHVGAPTSIQQVLDAQAYRYPGRGRWHDHDRYRQYRMSSRTWAGGRRPDHPARAWLPETLFSASGMAMDFQTAPGKVPLQLGLAAPSRSRGIPGDHVRQSHEVERRHCRRLDHDLTGFAVDTLTAGAARRPTPTIIWRILRLSRWLELAGGNLVAHQVGLQPELGIQTTSGGSF